MSKSSRLRHTAFWDIHYELTVGKIGFRYVRSNTGKTKANCPLASLTPTSNRQIEFASCARDNAQPTNSKQTTTPTPQVDFPHNRYDVMWRVASRQPNEQDECECIHCQQRKENSILVFRSGSLCERQSDPQQKAQPAKPSLCDKATPWQYPIHRLGLID